jgi:hypothetical protein
MVELAMVVTVVLVTVEINGNTSPFYLPAGRSLPGQMYFFVIKRKNPPLPC